MSRALLGYVDSSRSLIDRQERASMQVQLEKLKKEKLTTSLVASGLFDLLMRHGVEPAEITAHLQDWTEQHSGGGAAEAQVSYADVSRQLGSVLLPRLAEQQPEGVLASA